MRFIPTTLRLAAIGLCLPAMLLVGCARDPENVSTLKADMAQGRHVDALELANQILASPENYSADEIEFARSVLPEAETRVRTYFASNIMSDLTTRNTSGAIQAFEQANERFPALLRDEMPVQRLLMRYYAQRENMAKAVEIAESIRRFAREEADRADADRFLETHRTWEAAKSKTARLRSQVESIGTRVGVDFVSAGSGSCSIMSTEGLTPEEQALISEYYVSDGSVNALFSELVRGGDPDPVNRSLTAPPIELPAETQGG